MFGGGNGKDEGSAGDVAADGNLVYPAEGDASAANGVRYTPDSPRRPLRPAGQHEEPGGERRSNGPFDMTDFDLVLIVRSRFRQPNAGPDVVVGAGHVRLSWVWLRR